MGLYYFYYFFYKILKTGKQKMKTTNGNRNE